MFLVVLAYLAFFSIALPDSTLGVAWPSMRLDFGLSTGAAGLVPPVGVAATLVATAFASRLAARFGVGRLLAASTWLSAAALVVSATSPGFTQFLVSVALMGLSGGAIDATINAYAARTFGARRINLLHASFVVGAALSPLLVTAFVQSGLGWRWPYVVIAALQLALGLLFLITQARWAAPVTTSPGEGTASKAPPMNARPADVAIGIVAVAVQTGIESAVALWAFTFLTLGQGVDPVAAGLLASGYWLVMFAGRVVLGSLAERVGAWPVLSRSSGRPHRRRAPRVAGRSDRRDGRRPAVRSRCRTGLSAADPDHGGTHVGHRRGRCRRLPGGRLLRGGSGVPAADRTGNGPVGRRLRSRGHSSRRRRSAAPHRDAGAGRSATGSAPATALRAPLTTGTS